MAKKKTKKKEEQKDMQDLKQLGRFKVDTVAEMAKEDVSSLEQFDWKPLLDQIEGEYEVAQKFMKPKWDEWALRLKLYNNQKRNKEAIGDPLLFTIQQTVLASLYEDRLTVEFQGRERGDEDTAENLNILAEFDYDEMEKDQLDYDWDFDTCFFGRGLVLNMEFDRKIKAPMPEVIDPMTFLRDPNAKSAQGDRKGRGAMQFGGYEFKETKREMDKSGQYFNTKDLKSGFNSSAHSLLDRNQEARAEAQGHDHVRNTQKGLSGDNKEFRLLKWFTYWKGVPVMVVIGEERKKVVRFVKLKGDKFPINDRALFPTSHDWDGVSIPDIVEDKQRARAVLQNLALKTAKIGLHPTLLFDSNKIKNKNDLNVEFNKHIPVDGSPAGAVDVLQRQGVKQEVQFILDMLSSSAERAMATPDQQVGVPNDEKRTATEVAEVSGNVDKRFSLSARVFGWSEKRFWRDWYGLYKAHFKSDIDEKIARIKGAMGTEWRGFTRENIITNIDPDIEIESRALAEAKRLNQLQQFRAYMADIAQDPNANVRYARKRLGKLHGLRKDEIDRLLPPTVDEMQAEEENMLLNENERAVVQVNDDHIAHLEIHNKALDTPAKIAHINAHKRALLLKKNRPDLFDQGVEGQPASDLNPDQEGVNADVELPQQSRQNIENAGVGIDQ